MAKKHLSYALRILSIACLSIFLSSCNDAGDTNIVSRKTPELKNVNSGDQIEENADSNSFSASVSVNGTTESGKATSAHYSLDGGFVATE